MNRRKLLLGAGAVALAKAAPKVRVGVMGIQHSHLTGKLQAMGAGSAFELVSVCLRHHRLDFLQLNNYYSP